MNVKKAESEVFMSPAVTDRQDVSETFCSLLSLAVPLRPVSSEELRSQSPLEHSASVGMNAAIGV